MPGIRTAFVHSIVYSRVVVKFEPTVVAHSKLHTFTVYSHAVVSILAGIAYVSVLSGY